ncbi:unnamed protein product [Adineta ricciae]|uniref:Tetratricopeptide repeat protein n=1 Tax=Adineta ricciae TaxID=249248 RepID=A0A816E921_ADIRI|nr:unnamed protein product [Adineta ricciae]
MGTQLVPLVHGLHQLHSVYIFCFNKPKYDQWAKQFNKIRGVYTEIDEICDYLRKYFAAQSTISDEEQLQFDIFRKNPDLASGDRQDVPFLHSILIKLILSNMNLIKIEDMINYCRIEYSSPHQQHLINDLEKVYTQYDPVWWYTRDSFLQTIVNRALQINDLFTLCTMSPFIQQLVKQLATSHEEQNTSMSKDLVLYSYQLLSFDDFEKIRLNQGGLMCINQFTSANSEKAIPLTFLQHQAAPPAATPATTPATSLATTPVTIPGATPAPAATPASTFATTPTTDTVTINPIQINAILNITIPHGATPNVPFANIGADSDFVHENDYLISMTSIYRIDKLEQFPEDPASWHIYLTLIGEKDEQYTDIVHYLTLTYKLEESTLPELASSVTHKLYQFKSTRKLFEKAYSSKIRQMRTGLMNYNMGVIYDCMSEYAKAISEYKYGVEFVRQTTPDGFSVDHACLAPVFSNVGISYERLHVFSNAVDHGFRAVTIVSDMDEKTCPFRKELLASAYFNLGLIHELDMKFPQAKMFYEQALKYRRQVLSPEHPDMKSLKHTLSLLTSE